LPALCIADNSRISAYKLIAILCEWRSTIGREVLRYLNPVHESIPPLTGIDMYIHTYILVQILYNIHIYTYV
jgi:uncharacterized protein YggT (Ycf19 family)